MNPSEDDDALARRVHAPLPATRATFRVSPHPPLRAAGQCRASRESGACSETAGRQCNRGPDPTRRRGSGHRVGLADLLVSVLRNADDRGRDPGAWCIDSCTARTARRPVMTSVLPDPNRLSASGIARPRADGLCLPTEAPSGTALSIRRQRSMAAHRALGVADQTDYRRRLPGFNASGRLRAGRIPIARRSP